MLGLAVAVDTLRRALNVVGSPWIPLWVRVALCLLLAFVGLRALGFSARAIGLRPWREWNATQRSYFIQILILANMLFPMMFSAELSRAFAESSALAVAAGFIGYVFLGFLQELVYRGILQMEFTRRWGALAGILVSNLLYTFVQHSSYFASAASLAVPMFAGIFAMGLVFAMVFWRSGNLWSMPLATRTSRLPLVDVLETVMTTNKATVEHFMEGFRKSDHEQILSCLTEDVEWEVPAAFHVRGKAEFDGHIESEAFVGSPAITVTRMTEEDDVVVAEGLVRTQRRDGAILNLAFCDVFDLRDGKIRRLVSYLVATS